MRPHPIPVRRRPALGPLLFLAALLLAACGSTRAPAAAEDPALAARIERIVEADSLDDGFWGLQVVDLESGRILYRRNADKNFVPASNLKLITTAAALELLGPDYRYRTQLFMDGPVVDGTLHGNLIVRGSGDPTFGAGRFTDGDLTRTFRQWADSLRAHGVERIAGDIIGDDDIFGDVRLGAGWSWDDLPYWYAAELGGLVFNDNNVDFAIRGVREGQPAEVTWEPFGTDYVEVVNATRTISPDSSIVEGYAREPGTNVIRLSSLVPEGRTDTESLTVSNPTLFFAHVFRESLLRAGLPVRGRPVDADELSIRPAYGALEMRRVAVHESPPVSEIVRVINKRSQNLYAEQLFRTLGVLAPAPPGEPAVGTAARARRAVYPFLAAAGVDTLQLQIEDGSGLSRLSLVSPEALARLLAYMHAHPVESVRDAFLGSLAIPGETGTLRNFRTGVPEGSLRAKTGALGNVRALSGYVTSSSGRPLAFSILSNHLTAPSRSVVAAQEAIVSLLADYRP